MSTHGYNRPAQIVTTEAGHWAGPAIALLSVMLAACSGSDGAPVANTFAPEGVKYVI